MKKEHGTLKQCLQKTIHHTGYGKARLMDAVGHLTVEEVQYRFDLVRANTEAAAAQLDKVKQAAIKAGCKEVLAVLEEKTVEFGHDWGKILNKESVA